MHPIFVSVSSLEHITSARPAGGLVQRAAPDRSAPAHKGLIVSPPTNSMERYTRLASRAHVGAVCAAANIRAARASDSQFGADSHHAQTFPQTMATAHTHSAPAPSDRRSEGRAGSRRIFPPQFKLQVLDAYRRDTQCRGNQRATARKFGIHRRQIQKWLQAEPALRAALLRRAPQPAPSPPPYSVGSPESARLPSPPPASTQVPTITTTVQVPTPLAAPVPVMPPSTEPIDLSVRRLSPTPVPILCYPQPTVPEHPQPRKPFKLFRPYLMEDDQEKRPSLASLPVSDGLHVSAFVPVQSAAVCSLAACSAPRWCAPAPTFSAPLR